MKDSGNCNPLKDAKLITNSLRKIRKSMELGLKQADLAVSVLAQDGESLRDASNDHKYELKNALLHTKKNLNRVKNIEEREKYSLIFSMSFFTGTVVYIISKRLRLISIAWLTIQSFLYARNKISSKSVVDIKHREKNNDILREIKPQKSVSSNDDYHKTESRVSVLEVNI